MCKLACVDKVRRPCACVCSIATSTVSLWSLKEYNCPLALTLLEWDAAQAEKVYVQHRMREHGAALYDLIERRGGNIYVCGDGANMAKVEPTFTAQCQRSDSAATLESTRSSCRSRLSSCGCLLQQMCWDALTLVLLLCLTKLVCSQDVHSALVDIFADNGQLSSADAAARVAELAKAHRYVRDIWS